ncbi:BrnA antitoxin family protein [Hoeflea alexandrii]|uniref:BrnA antitoxin family protein n=1 Tax=Hoeflea alexandrii TaxID=288436 RepID=UPI0035D0CC4D
MKPPRRTGSAFERAEAAFKSATTKPAAPAPARSAAVPEGKETVSIRLDRAVLEHFQEDGPGWQDRINAALRTAAGLEGE